MIKKTLAAVICLIMAACNSNANNTIVEEPVVTEDSRDSVIVEQQPVYGTLVCRDSCHIVVSKPDLKLYVYETQNGDTVLIADYPVCVAKNYGQKQKKGDMKTPECTVDNPFHITEITPASTWTHDFGDGRGSILAYGDWFMRLKTPGFSGIGIHGSTNNEASVPGRGSEGCIRLRNDDLNELKEKYAFVGMKVVIEKDTIF